MERWRAITDTDGRYHISDRGRVRSNGWVAKCADGRKLRVPPKILSTRTSHSAGYVMVNLHLVDGTRRHVHVHHLVLEEFVGPRPPGYYGCHNNGDGSDNRVENLRWDSPAGNGSDKLIHGTEYNVNKNHCGACGFAYDESNTYWWGPNKRWRRCRNCMNQYQRTTYHRRLRKRQLQEKDS